MTKNLLISYILFAAIFLILSSPYPALSNDKHYNEWSFEIKNDVEISKRDYLLVYSPQEKDERRIRVISQCRHPLHNEGVYGTCTHEIKIQPTNKKFIINTGEDVVMFSFWGGQLILGTREYGCCGGSDTIRFYTEKGEYLGYIEDRDFSERANYANLILRTYDIRNASFDMEKNYMLMNNVSNHELEAFVFGNNIEKRKRIPLLLSIGGKDKCDEWLIKEFKHYGDRPDMSLTMAGYFCKEEVDEEQIFKCSGNEKELSCIRDKVQKQDVGK
jgi:hypothetical protein